jgi:hypothetical protein
MAICSGWRRSMEMFHPWMRASIPVDRGSGAGRAVVDLQTIHIRDMDVEHEFPVSHALAQGFAYRTVLATPLLREGVAIGAIVIRRLDVRPFTDTADGNLAGPAGHLQFAGRAPAGVRGNARECSGALRRQLRQPLPARRRVLPLGRLAQHTVGSQGSGGCQSGTYRRGGAEHFSNIA